MNSELEEYITEMNSKGDWLVAVLDNGGKEKDYQIIFDERLLAFEDYMWKIRKLFERVGNTYLGRQRSTIPKYRRLNTDNLIFAIISVKGYPKAYFNTKYDFGDFVSHPTEGSLLNYKTYAFLENNIKYVLKTNPIYKNIGLAYVSSNDDRWAREDVNIDKFLKGYLARSKEAFNQTMAGLGGQDE